MIFSARINDITLIIYESCDDQKVLGFAQSSFKPSFM